MALSKSINFGNGVETDAAYIIVSNISLDYVNKTVNFAIKTYLTKEVKDEGLLTILPDENFRIGNINPGQIIDPNAPVVEDLFIKYFLNGDAQVNVETYLKTLDKFADCVTV